MALNKFLQGITKETFEAFSARTNGDFVLSFVRADKNAEHGSIYFGSRQYATSDFMSNDENLLVEYTPSGGLNINQNLQYDYEFEAVRDTEHKYQRVFYLPDGSYTLLVEKWANGFSQNSIISISTNAYGLNHSEYSVGYELMYYWQGGANGYYLAIPTSHPMAPTIRYRVKILASSVVRKDKIERKDTFFSENEERNIKIIPCITNNPNVINITTGESTYVTTAETTVVDTEVVGACKIVTNASIMDYIIYTDEVDDASRISAKTYADSALTEVTDFAEGIYRFKFTDTVTNGFVVAGENSSYAYTGDIYANSILTLTIDGSYSSWTLDKPQIYSSGNTVTISMDEDGGFNLEVPEQEFDFDITSYDLSIPNSEHYTAFLEIPKASEASDIWRLSLVGNDSSMENMAHGEITVNGLAEVKVFGTIFPKNNILFCQSDTGDNIVLYIKNANVNAPLYMKMLGAPENDWAWGDLSTLDTEDIFDVFSSDVKNEISPEATSNPYSNYSGDTEISIPTVQAVIDYTLPMLSGVSYDGEVVPVNNRIAKIVSMKPSYDGQYKYSLLTSYFGLRGAWHNYCIPLLTVRVRQNNGDKFNIGFRIHSTNCDNRNFTGEYFFDSHDVDEFARRSTFGCLDFSERTYITGYGGYNEEMDKAQWDDIFMTVEENGKYGYNDYFTEYKVRFYKRCLTDYSMFNFELDYVHGGHVQVDFHSCGYYSDEAIQSSLFGVENNANEKAYFGEYKFTHSRSIPVLISEIEAQYGENLHLPTDYREGQGGGSGDGLSGITINQSSQGVSINDNVADLSIKDWTSEIQFLSGRIDTLINSLDVQGEGGGGGGGGSSDITQIWQEIYAITAQLQTLQSEIANAGCTAITYSDGTTSYTKEIDDDHVIDLGVIQTGGGGGTDTYAYIDETGEWLWVYSKKTGQYEKIAVSVISVKV